MTIDDATQTEWRDELDPYVSWALAQGGWLARVAREGYNVRHTVLDRVCELLSNAVIAKLETTSITIREGSPLWNHARWEKRVPDERALEAHDAIRAILPDISKPDTVVLDLYPVQRYRETPNAPPTTVILVKVLAPGLLERAVLFPVPR